MNCISENNAASETDIIEPIFGIKFNINVKIDQNNEKSNQNIFKKI